MPANINFCRECGSRVENQTKGCDRCNNEKMSVSLKLIDIVTKNPRITLKIMSVVTILFALLLIYILNKK